MNIEWTNRVFTLQTHLSVSTKGITVMMQALRGMKTQLWCCQAQGYKGWCLEGEHSQRHQHLGESRVDTILNLVRRGRERERERGSQVQQPRGPKWLDCVGKFLWGSKGGKPDIP